MGHFEFPGRQFSGGNYFGNSGKGHEKCIFQPPHNEMKCLASTNPRRGDTGSHSQCDFSTTCLYARRPPPTELGKKISGFWATKKQKTFINIDHENYA